MEVPDHVKVMADAPAVVTLPYQISSSPPTDPANCTALVQVVTPPPETDDTVPTVAVPAWAKTTSTSPAVLGDTARVVRPEESAEVKVPTAVMEVAGKAEGELVSWFTAEVPPVVVTRTSTVAADSAGEVAVMEVALFTVKLVAATVPNLTALAPVKLVPVMVTAVPPAVLPELGLTPVTVGAGGTLKVNWSAGWFTAEVPPVVVTRTSTVVADSAGEVAVMEVALLTVKPVAAVAPKDTALAPVKLVPVMVTVAPLAVLP